MTVGLWTVVGVVTVELGGGVTVVSAPAACAPHIAPAAPAAPVPLRAHWVAAGSPPLASPAKTERGAEVGEW